MSLTTIWRGGHARACALLLSLAITATATAARMEPGDSPVLNEVTPTPSALLAVDQHRTTVVERIVSEWGDKLVAAGAGVSREQLREMLFAMRADQLLAASLAGSLDGLRDVVAQSPVAAKGVAVTKSLGDLGTDVVYVPVTPCRLVDTRAPYPAVYQNAGPFSAGQIRTYTVQGGNGVCLTQLPAGLTPAAVQLQVFGIPANGVSGDIEVLPQGATFGSSATLVFLGNNQFTSAGTTARINQINKQISVQVRLGIADVAIDVVGYFRRPTNYGGTHVITGLYATDSGGADNTASGVYSTVGGGSTNTASGYYSTVAGGIVNTASGVYSTVSGGISNTASGGSSVVAGGTGNTAAGANSVALGGGAMANHDGAFVFADNSSGLFSSTVPNQFMVAASGGIGLFTNKNSSMYCVINAGSGTWSCSSSRAVKRDFEAVDAAAVLAKVATLPVSSWRYMNEPDSIRHLGPFAEDFRAAFGLGADDKSIATIDEGGVALAAIQGLNAKVEQQAQAKHSEISALKDEVAELRRAVELLMAPTSTEGRVTRATSSRAHQIR